jgi:hypothetical protein
MKLSGINQLWVADITYIRLKAEFVYLAVILDGFSRKVVGWARNPRLPIWKLVLEYGVLQSECRVRWAERALAFMTNRNRSKKQ